MAAPIAVKNISTGARGAYAKGALVMANPGEVIEADDFVEEWFEAVEPVKTAHKHEPVKVEAKVAK